MQFPTLDAQAKQDLRARLAKAAQYFREHRGMLLGVGAAGAALLIAGFVLLVKHPATAPAATARTPAAAPIPAQPVALTTPPPPPLHPSPAAPPPKPSSQALKPASAPAPAAPKPVPAPTVAAPAPPAEPAQEEPKPKVKQLHVNIKKAMYSCSTEIGLLCNEFQSKPWDAVRCLKEHSDNLMPACTKSLEPVED